MQLSFIVLLSFLLAVAVSASKNSKTISASVKDTSVDGLNGLNIQLSAPFKFKDYVVGFKYNLGDLKKAPESLFAKKSITTPADGTATVDVSYKLDDKTTDVSATWNSDKVGLELTANGNSDDYLTSVGATSTQTVGGNKLGVSAAYCLLKKKLSAAGKLTVDDTAVEVTYDTEAQDPVLAVSHKLDASNTIAPSVSLKNGAVKYGWTRKWTGGSLDTTFTPGDKVVLEWKDEGANGTWKTKADIPIENQANTKVSFSRDWSY